MSVHEARNNNWKKHMHLSLTDSLTSIV